MPNDKKKPAKSDDTNFLEKIDKVDLDKWGSGSGLLDLSLKADDSQFGAALDDIYPAEGDSNQVGSDVAKSITGERDFEVFHYDSEMGKQGWYLKDDLYYDGNRAVVFVQKKDALKPKAYLIWGYDFFPFIEQDKHLKDIECKVDGGQKTKSLYDLIKNEIRQKKFMVDGKKPFARIYEKPPYRGKARVLLGYAVEYDPDEDIDGQVKTISDDARALYADIENVLNQALEYAKKGKVRYVSALDAVEMHTSTCKRQGGASLLGTLAGLNGVDEVPPLAPEVSIQKDQISGTTTVENTYPSAPPSKKGMVASFFNKLASFLPKHS